MKIQIKKLALLILIIAFVPLEVLAQSEPSIPTNFATYTDEVNLFSVSYPANWEPAFSIIESLKQETDNYLKSIDEKGYSEKNNVVFLGGVPLDSGYYNPNITIAIHTEPLVDDNVKLEDVVEVLAHECKRISEEYREFSRTKTIIDERQAIIWDFEARSPNMPLVHSLIINMFIDKYLWTITCGVGPPLNFYDFKDDLYATLKSFKILKKPNSSSTIEKGRGFENEKTIEELNQDIKENSQNADLYNEKGNKYLLDKKYQKAIEEFDKAIKINENYAEPYNGKGIAYRNLGEYHEAIENYTKAIELYPSYFEAYNNRGVCFIFLGENDKACFDFKKACELGSCQKLELAKQKGLCK